MSAQSRALNMLADHCEYLAASVEGYTIPIYTGADQWHAAADMARRAAEEQSWRRRLARKLGAW